MWRHYVYLHRKATDGSVFYVGKGTERNGRTTPLYSRSRDHKKRNRYWVRSAAKYGLIVEIHAMCIDDEASQELEKALIATYGKAANGGQLCNMTDGGDGHAGLSPSEETRRKVSDANKGAKRTLAQRMAISKAQKGVKNSKEQNEAHSRRMSGAGNHWYGRTPSEETLRKRSESMRGKLAGSKHPFYGKKRPGVSAKLSGGKSYMAKPVIDTVSGARYACSKDAANAAGVSPQSLSRWLNGVRHNPTNLRFA